MSDSKCIHLCLFYECWLQTLVSCRHLFSADTFSCQKYSICYHVCTFATDQDETFIDEEEKTLQSAMMDTPKTHYIVDANGTRYNISSSLLTNIGPNCKNAYNFRQNIVMTDCNLDPF